MIDFKYLNLYKKGRLLDIGCSHGGFLKILQKYNFMYRYRCQDNSEKK